MFEHAQKREIARIRFEAAIHGIKLPGNEKEQKQQVEQQQGGIPLFGDPEEYKKMSKEEQDKLTEKMMAGHKVWAGTWKAGKSKVKIG